MFFTTAIGWIPHDDPTDVTLQARDSLLRIVDEERLFSYQDESARTLLSLEVNMAALVFLELKNDLDRRKEALKLIVTLTRVEFDLVSPIVTRLLPVIFVAVSILSLRCSQILLTCRVGSRIKNRKSDVA
jgi:hypothetical protein